MLRPSPARTALAGCLAACLLSGPAHAQTPLGPGFTYSGQLSSGGLPANGAFNFSFRLYTAAVGGTLLGTDAINGAQVSDGVFTVILNENDEFGVSAFNGSRRWLEVSVNGTPLAPRQELTATPYALFAAAPWELNGTSLSYVGGNVGIGTAAPASPLTIQAPGNGLTHSDGTHVLATNVSGGAGWLGTITASPLNFYTANSAARMTVTTAGNVGVGTTTPAQKLSVAGTIQSTSGGFMFPDGSVQSTAATGGGGFWSASGINIFNNNTGNVGIGTSAPNAKLALVNNSQPTTTLDLGAPAKGEHFSHIHFGGFGDWYIRSASSLGNVIIQDHFGYVGIGTAAPTHKLTIQTSFPDFGWVHTDGTRQVASYVDVSGGWLGTRSNHSLHFFTNNSVPRATLTTAGKFGIGTQTPVCPLHAISTESGVSGIYGVATAGTTNGGVYAESTASNGNGLIAQANNGSNAYGVWGRATNGIGGYFTGGNYAIYAAGRVRVGVLEIAGADVAEKFPCSEPAADGSAEIEPGTVMEIDPANPGQLRIARQAYSSRVAGVVSGAGNLPVGAVLGHIEESKDGPAIALSGRVWVMCDAGSAPITPGDLLTTSDTAGHAMKSLDRDRAHGAVLGKAMTSLESGRGLVLVLVNLQ